MREIRFKVWDKKCECWLDSFRLDRNGQLWMCTHSGDGGEIWDKANKEQVEIVLFTGLKDKNGVEICEGDIVTNHAEGWINAVVRFQDGKFCIMGEQMYVYCGLEVIGNIYENKELLNGKT